MGKILESSSSQKEPLKIWEMVQPFCSPSALRSRELPSGTRALLTAGTDGWVPLGEELPPKAQFCPILLSFLDACCLI